MQFASKVVRFIGIILVVTHICLVSLSCSWDCVWKGKTSSPFSALQVGGGREECGIYKIWLNISGYTYHILNVTALESVTCYASSVVFSLWGTVVTNCNFFMVFQLFYCELPTLTYWAIHVSEYENHSFYLAVVMYFI